MSGLPKNRARAEDLTTGACSIRDSVGLSCHAATFSAVKRRDLFSPRSIVGLLVVFQTA